MKVSVRLFAVARQLAQTDVVEIELQEGATVADVRAILAQRLPALGAVLPRMLVAVDSDYAVDETMIRPGAEVACIPPVSGG